MPELQDARERAPVLLEELRELDPKRAEFVEDVFSEVLRGLRRCEMKDPLMVEWLFESLYHHLQEVKGEVRVREDDLPSLPGEQVE